MKLGIKIGDKAKVLTGKHKGQEATVAGFDKKTARVRLTGLKVSKSGKKELHGSFHRKSIEVVKVEAPAAAEAAAQ